jgi:Ca-activated chloride channel family protein
MIFKTKEVLMIHTPKPIAVCAVVLWLLLGSIAYSQPLEAEDKTLSPYFFVKSDDPEVDRLPLESTSALVHISGVIAEVQVTQVYKNEGKRPLEAIYVFPASTHAAVFGMKMTIGERVIEAKIKKRAEARKEYEQARERGQSASLLEQQRPNVFQMNVANIMPADNIRVELKYTELLVPTDRVYEFVYPTVVGPRYSNQPAEQAPPSEFWMQNPYLHQGEAPTYSFDITVDIAAGMPIRDLSCPSHKVRASFDGPGTATVRLDRSETRDGNRDYLLRYRLGGDSIHSGLLLFEGKKENFFLLMMQPPKRVEKKEIPGREYIFIVDVSGSMHGFPLEISKKLLIDLIGKLRPKDKFNVLLFSGGSSLMAEESLPATGENIRRAIQTIQRQRGGGGTELLPALKRALNLRRPENYSRTLVVVTDGYVTVEEEAFDLIRENLGSANLFAFGIGTSVNRHLMEGMARVGMGEPFIITKPEEAPAKAERFRDLIRFPVLTGIRVEFQGFQTYDVEPIAVPDVLAERPVIVFGKWRGRPQGTIHITGTSGRGKYKSVVEVEKVKAMETNDALRYLWARHRISLLSDYNLLRPDDQRKEQVTQLGLDYNLLTAYTSFVAVDSEVRNQGGQGATVKQPLPLPQGVSDYAVGGMKLSRFSAAPMAALKVQDEAKRELVREEPGDKEKGRNKISLKDVTTAEGLSKEDLLAFVQKKISSLEASFGKEKGSGEIILQLVLDPQGKVQKLKVLFTSLQDPHLQQVICDEVKKWVFPVRPGTPEIKINLSFVCKTQS